MGSGRGRPECPDGQVGLELKVVMSFFIYEHFSYIIGISYGDITSYSSGVVLCCLTS